MRSRKEAAIHNQSTHVLDVCCCRYYPHRNDRTKLSTRWRISCRRLPYRRMWSRDARPLSQITGCLDPNRGRLATVRTYTNGFVLPPPRQTQRRIHSPFIHGRPATRALPADSKRATDETNRIFLDGLRVSLRRVAWMDGHHRCNHCSPSHLTSSKHMLPVPPNPH